MLRNVDYYDYGVNQDMVEAVGYTADIKTLANGTTPNGVDFEDNLFPKYLNDSRWTCLDMASDICVHYIEPLELCRFKADGNTTRLLSDHRSLAPYRDVEVGATCQCANGWERTWHYFC